MCLDNVTSTKRAHKATGYGWKVFRGTRNGLWSQYSHLGLQLQFLKVGVWLRSSDDRTGDYPLGFHIFQTKKEALCWIGREHHLIVRKVAWRDHLARGLQYFGCSNLRTTVAKEMKILK